MLGVEELHRTFTFASGAWSRVIITKREKVLPMAYKIMHTPSTHDGAWHLLHTGPG